MKILLSVLILLSVEILPLDREKFYQIIDLISEEKFSEAEFEIDKLKDQSGDDSEYYVLIFNLYAAKAQTSHIGIKKEAPEDSLVLSIKDSAGNTVGYLGESIEYSIPVVNEGIKLFKPALKKFENRLDLFFGLASLTLQCNMYNELANTLNSIIRLSVKHNNNWVWSFNEPLEDEPKDFMLNNLQAYINELFNKEDSTADSIVIDISEKMIESYPGIIFGYNNLGAIYYLRKNYKLAKKYFLEAEIINSKDILVLANLAQISKMQNEITAAEEYYNKIINYGSESDKAWAAEQIRLLKE